MPGGVAVVLGSAGWARPLIVWQAASAWPATGWPALLRVLSSRSGGTTRQPPITAGKYLLGSQTSGSR
jgi:hypothetical protein